MVWRVNTIWGPKDGTRLIDANVADDDDDGYGS